jgi:UDPglucose 6-dehydrogenase
MKVGFIGLGKLGLPVALAVEAAGHHVKGFDPSPEVHRILVSKSLPYREDQAQELLLVSGIEVIDPQELSEWADLIFVAVQTPHQPEYEGITRLGEERADFDYTYLFKAVASIDQTEVPIVVISTVLPGTIEKVLFNDLSLWLDRDQLLYNPFFIAMGTTIHDFRNPEFVLIGTDGAHPGILRDFYATIHDRPLFVTTIKTAELTKVAYNTFIGLKIAFGNTMMELCEKTGADVDDLVDALGLARERLWSTAYLRGGMGDGGGCHPRDNIALSWLAKEVGLSFDLFEALMVCREKQTEWLAEVIFDEQTFRSDYHPITILGKAYKPETNLTVGSPALLLAEIMNEQGIAFEHEDDHV